MKKFKMSNKEKQQPKESGTLCLLYSIFNLMVKIIPDMKNKLQKTTINQILTFQAADYKKIFQKEMRKSDRQLRFKSIKSSYEAQNFYFEVSSAGKLKSFIQVQPDVKNELGDEVFCISACFCVNESKYRRRFYSKIKALSLNARKMLNVKKMFIVISQSDITSKKYFDRSGEVTAFELVGNTKFGLDAINSENIQKDLDVKIKKIKKTDIKKIVDLEIKSHLADKTSRMNKAFSDLRARKVMTSFYNVLLKEKSCFVIYKNKKIAGAIGYFLRPKQKIGFVGTLFVAHEFKGMGLSKLLYERLLEEFHRNKLPHYMGSTTTKNVLSFAKKLKRVEYRCIYLVEIE